MNILLRTSDPSLGGLADKLSQAGYCLSHLPSGADAARRFPSTTDVLIVDGVPQSPLEAETQAVLRRKCREDGCFCLLLGADPEDIADDPYTIPLPLPLTAGELHGVLGLIRSHLSLVRTNARLDGQVRHLEARLDGEQRLVRQMFDQFITGEQLDDAAVHYWTNSKDILGHDFLLVAHTPAGVLHIMYADEMGKNTLGAISAFPIITPFYRMTEKGFGIDAILREANSRLYRFYPEGHPVAATLISLDFNDGVLHVWNGGTPSPILINKKTSTTTRATSCPGLGVVRPEHFVPVTDVWTLQGEELLALGSWGLFQQLTPDPLADAALPAFHAWLKSQISPDLKVPGGLPLTGDASLLLVDCRQSEAPVQELPAARQERASLNGEWTFSLSIGPAEMRTVDVVPLLLGGVGQLVTNPAMGGVLFVILSELYNNALDHGVLGLNSALKLGPDGMGAFLDERARRLGCLMEGRIELALNQTLAPEGPVLTITCVDSGRGFDHARLHAGPIANAETLPYGRGLALVSSLASAVEFNQEGNRVSVRLAVMMNDSTESKLSS